MNTENLSPKKVLFEKADALLETGIPVKISITARTKWDKTLQFLKIKPKERIFYLKPLCLGTLIKISREILMISNETFEELQSDRIKTYLAIVQNTPIITRVIGMAIMNSEKDPPESLLKLIRQEFTAVTLTQVLGIVLHKMDIKSFLISIISVRGLNVLKTEMSPIDQRSSIASGAPSEE